MRIRPHRLLPALVVGALLVFALLGATDPARAPSGAVPASLYYPVCTDLLESVSPDSSLVLGYYEGVVQPLGTTGNIAVCSLGVRVPNYSSLATMELKAWDPVALAPDPTTVALRTYTFGLSTYASWLSAFTFVPPLVLQSLGNVAETPRATTAIRFENQATYYFGNYYAFWTPNAAAGVPTAYHYAAGGAHLPFPGPHPAFSHFICGGDQALQNLYVCQGVVRCDSMYGNDVSAVVQRFRVEQRVQLDWIELAFGPVNAANPNGAQPGEVLVLDAQGQSQPPASASGALASAGFMNTIQAPVWASHYDFDRSITLEPHHDYWLWVATAWDYGLYLRHRAAVESPPFEAGVGELWFLKGYNPPWTLDPHNSLDFKVIGLPLDVTAVPRPPVAVSALRLAIGPNPSRGIVQVAWSGGRGDRVRFTVLDARGRQVASGEAGGAGSGSWRFRGARDDGRPLPAGIYFVRAVDAGGQAAVERMVLVR